MRTGLRTTEVSLALFILFNCVPVVCLHVSVCVNAGFNYV